MSGKFKKGATKTAIQFLVPENSFWEYKELFRKVGSFIVDAIVRMLLKTLLKMIWITYLKRYVTILQFF